MANGTRDAQKSSTTQFELSDAQRVAWLRLIRSENVGAATFRDLINHCGSAQTAIEMLPELAKRGGRLAKVRVTSQAEAEDELSEAKRSGARIIGIGEPDYPPMLRMMASAPPLVTVKGNIDLATRPSVGIVGSRNASMVGLKVARSFASDLGQHGFAIVSGLARGIDKAAHEASVSTGTTAVLAGGLNRPYPPENLEILARIENDGFGYSVSEQPLNWEPRARDFPKRNRLIAGLSAGVIVVEATKRSGSLITARLAGEIGRLVLAIPGSPLDPRSQGTNGLIRDGATLVGTPEEVVEAIQPTLGSPRQSREQPSLLEPENTFTLPAPESVRAQVLSLLGPTPTDLDDVIAETGASPSEVFLIVLELDLAGRIERHSGNRVSLIE
ncbi:MAG: DNA-processing protein DprA [Pseudomonadota bacterium]